MTRATIWIGDLLISMKALAPANGDTLDAIAELLGLERGTVAPVEPEAPGPATSPAPPSGDALPPAAPFTGSFPVADLPGIAPQAAAPGEPRGAIEPLQLTSAVAARPPVPAPLLSPLAGRFIAQELVTSSRFGPDPDVGRLVDALARREIPQPVPLAERQTLARGVQVLVDQGEGMEPFAADQRGMVDLLRRLAGDALVEARKFYEVPGRDDPIHPWEPPPPGMPVLALTDLGLAGRVECGAAEVVAGWQSAAAVLAARGSSLVALVPFPPGRWPEPLTACMRIVLWDKPTTAAHARRARRR
jgi:hypothetical protein